MNKTERKFRVVKKLKKLPEYKSLFRTFQNQHNNTVFAHFHDNAFELLNQIAQDENWEEAGEVSKSSYPILRNYLNHTFKRLQEENKIVYSENKLKACFNTGLQTKYEKDIFAIFEVDKRHGIDNSLIKWRWKSFTDSLEDISEFPKPELATYIENTNDLVFDLSYAIDINAEHILDKNNNRLPKKYQGEENKYSTLHLINGATKGLKEKLKRNYKLAIPHWYNGKIQLLLPLNLSSSKKADLALVAEKDIENKIYYIKTALTMNMAYNNARLICMPDRDWLNP